MQVIEFITATANMATATILLIATLWDRKKRRKRKKR